MHEPTTKPLKVIPVVIEGHRAEIKQGLGTSKRPLHAALFKAVFDQVSTRSLDDARANRPAECQIALIIHDRAIPAEVGTDVGEHVLPRRGQFWAGRFQVVEQGIELVGQEPGQRLLDPELTVR